MLRSKIKNKIINLGFSKTGTTTIGAYFKLLGFKTIHDPKHTYISSNNVKQFLVDNTWTKYEAFSGLFPMCWKTVVDNSTNCSYILSVRNTESWIRSAKNHFKNRKNTPFRDKVFGPSNTKWNTSFIKIYEDYNRQVQEYFNLKDIPLLVVNIEDDNETVAEDIGTFLGLSGPFPSLPKRNVTNKSYGEKKYSIHS